MVRIGEAPFLECSSKGDKRFSAFYAKVKAFGGRSIEELYQAHKLFEDGTTNHSWKTAKGRKPVNLKSCIEFYSTLWDLYIHENPDLLDVLREASGLSDIFGQEGHQCQAVELWRIKVEDESRR